MARPAPALIVILLALLVWSTPAAAQGIRRCVDAQGMSVFTDRPCSEMNAVPMQAPPAGEGNLASGLRGGFSQRGCARSPEDLLDRVRSAVEARDVNRLAGHYHWSGTGSGSGRRLMDALERIAGRPLLSAELLYPEPPDAPAPPEDPYAIAPAPPDRYQPAAAPSPPREMRVLQMRGDDASQVSRTVFHLRRNAGCWWIEL